MPHFATTEGSVKISSSLARGGFPWLSAIGENRNRPYQATNPFLLHPGLLLPRGLSAVRLHCASQHGAMILPHTLLSHGKRGIETLMSRLRMLMRMRRCNGKDQAPSVCRLACARVCEIKGDEV